MTDTEKVLLYDKALRTYGVDAQVHMMFEESAELNNELAKTFRNRTTKEKIITELADVSIMTEQLALAYGLDEFMEEKERKLTRLKERLSKHDQERN